MRINPSEWQLHWNGMKDARNFDGFGKLMVCGSENEFNYIFNVFFCYLFVFEGFRLLRLTCVSIDEKLGRKSRR